VDRISCLLFRPCDGRSASSPRLFVALERTKLPLNAIVPKVTKEEGAQKALKSHVVEKKGLFWQKTRVRKKPLPQDLSVKTHSHGLVNGLQEAQISNLQAVTRFLEVFHRIEECLVNSRESAEGGSVERNCDPMDKNQIEGATDQGEQARDCEA